MTLRDDMLPVADELRGLFSEFGVARYTVKVRRESWSGLRPGLGTKTVVDLPILSSSGGSPLVEALTDISGRIHDISLPSGTIQAGDMVVSEITPAYASIGTVSSVAVGTGTVTPTVAIPSSGLTAPGTYSVSIEILSGAATFQYSLDGVTWVGPITITPNVAIPSIGVSLALAGTFEWGDAFAFLLSCGGYTPLQLRPTVAPGSGDDVYYVLVGDAAVDEPYTFVVGRFDDPVGYSLVLRRRVN